MGKKSAGRKRRASARRRIQKLRHTSLLRVSALDLLEPRILLAGDFTWNSPGGGAWFDPANWVDAAGQPVVQGPGLDALARLRRRDADA